MNTIKKNPGQFFFKAGLLAALVIILAFLVNHLYRRLSVVKLPLPENTCDAPPNWQGIWPGITTRQEVLEKLGVPNKEGSEKMWGSNYSYIAYQISGGSIAKYTTDKIFFRTDDVVDWMEIAVGDRTGSYQRISDEINTLGSTIDTFYINSNAPPAGIAAYDILSGPDEVYVWAGCGVAFITIPVEQMGAPMITIRHPIRSTGSDFTTPNANSVILKKIFFIPTSHQGFMDYYKHKLPYKSWSGPESLREYMKDVHQSLP